MVIFQYSFNYLVYSGLHPRYSAPLFHQSLGELLIGLLSHLLLYVKL